ESASRRSSRSSTRWTSCTRYRWNGAYHSRSQWVWGTMPTVLAVTGSGYEASVGADPPVADAGLGHDEARVGRVVTELAPQLPDVHAQVVALGAVPAPPHLSQQVLVREQLPRLGGELLEQRELGLGQVHDVAVAADLLAH